MKRNKLLSVLIAGLVFISVPLTSFASSKYVIEPPYKRQETKEIEVSRWAKEVVGISSQLGFLSDTLAKKTSFKSPITREEFTEIMMGYYKYRHRTLDSDGEIYIPGIKGSARFKDTNNKLILEAVNAGLINGDSDGNFKPNDPITKEDLIKVAVNYHKALDKVYYPDKNIKQQNINDMDKVSPSNIEDVKYAIENNFIIKDEYGNFNPKEFATIEEAIMVAYRSTDQSIKLKEYNVPLIDGTVRYGADAQKAFLELIKDRYKGHDNVFNPDSTPVELGEVKSLKLVKKGMNFDFMGETVTDVKLSILDETMYQANSYFLEVRLETLSGKNINTPYIRGYFLKDNKDDFGYWERSPHISSYSDKATFYQEDQNTLKALILDDGKGNYIFYELVSR